jgi:hypothetical protein
MKNKLGGFGLALALLAGLLLLPAAHAKRYLTREQAEKICFPEADKFEWKSHRYTHAQIMAIRAASGLKVIDPGLWFGVALQKDGQVLGVLVFDRARGKHEFIDYVIALTPEGKVRQIEILEYRESWGSEVRRDNWRRQFVNKHSKSKLKLHDGIHNISGATISCRNITDGVRRTCHAWHVVLRPALVTAGRLPKLSSK